MRSIRVLLSCILRARKSFDLAPSPRARRAGHMQRAVIESLEPRQLMTSTSISAPPAAVAGQTYTLTVNSADYMLAYEEVDIDWGDGNSDSFTGDGSNPSYSWNFTHSYSDAGTYYPSEMVLGGYDWEYDDSQEVDVRGLPAAPSDAHATTLLPTTVTLAWTPVDGAVAYQVGSQYYTTGTGTPSFTDDTVLPNGSYDYHIYSIDAYGDYSSTFADVSVTTPLGTITGLHLVSQTPTSAFIGWSSIQGAVNYEIDRSGGPVSHPAFFTPATALYDPTVAGGSIYSYQVYALNANGARISVGSSLNNISISATVDGNSLTDKAAAQISGGSVFATPFTSGTDTPVTLTWIATDNTSLMRYHVVRSDGFSFDLEADGGTSENATYTDRGVQPGTTYTYYIYPYDAAGNSPFPGVVTVMTMQNGSAPSTPQNLEAVQATEQSGSTPSEVVLAWSPSADSSGIAHYIITRYLNGIVDSTFTSSIAGITDTSLPSNWSEYSYKVAAEDAGGRRSGTITLSVAPSNQPLVTAEAATDQYIPENEVAFFYNELIARYRALAAVSGLSAVASQRWFDSSDHVIANGLIYSGLPLAPSAYFDDANLNGRYDPGEPAWINSTTNSSYQSGMPVLAGSPTIGMPQTGRLQYLPQTADGSYQRGEEVLTDVTQLGGASSVANLYAFRDLNGDGKWEIGEPVWRDTTGDHVFHAGASALVYSGGNPPVDGSFGKTTGIYSANIITGAGTRQLVWIDGLGTFNTDFASLYMGVEQLAPKFAPFVGSPAAWTAGALIAAAAPGNVFAGQGTATLTGGSAIVTGSQSFAGQASQGDWIAFNGDATGTWYQIGSISGSSMHLVGSYTGADNGVVVTSGFRTVNWTRLPTYTDASRALSLVFERGRPTASTPIFPIHFQELKNALMLFTDSSGHPIFPQPYYGYAQYNEDGNISAERALGIASSIITAHEAVFGTSNNNSYGSMITDGHIRPGAIIFESDISALRGLLYDLMSFVYVRDEANVEFNGWKITGDPDFPLPITFSDPLEMAELLPEVPDQRSAGQFTTFVVATGPGFAPSTIIYSPLQWTELEDVINQILANGLWVSRDSGPSAIDYSDVESRTTLSDYNGVTEPFVFSPVVVDLPWLGAGGPPSTWLAQFASDFVSFSTQADGLNVALGSADDIDYYDLSGSEHTSMVSSISVHAILPDNTNPFGGDALDALSVGPQEAGIGGSGWAWNARVDVFTLSIEKAEQILDYYWSNVFPGSAGGPTEIFLDGTIDSAVSGFARCIKAIYGGDYVGTVVYPGGGISPASDHLEIGLVIPLGLDIYGKVPNPTNGPILIGDSPDPVVAPVGPVPAQPTLPPLTNAMDASNVIPDSNLDGIVNVPQDVDSFGNSTGMMGFDAYRNTPQVYIPIFDDTQGGVPVHAYLTQGAFAAATDSTVTLASTLWKYPDVSQNGLSWGYSLDERVVPDLVIWNNVNHVMQMTVYRPGGNAVTFNFAWNPSTQTFSNFGYPVGARDGRRTYVLHASEFTNTAASSGMPAQFELRFDDGTVHAFDGNGHLSAIRTADGRSVTLPLTNPLAQGPNPLSASGTGSATPTGASSLQYSVTLGWANGRLDSVKYQTRLGTAPNLSYIKTQLGYTTTTGLGSINILSKKVVSPPDLPVESNWPESSYTLLNPQTIANNGNTLARIGSIAADGSGSVTLTVSSPDNFVGASDAFVFNTDGMLVSQTHTYNGSVVTTAATSYTYYAPGSTARYSANGAPTWNKVKEVTNPDTSWKEYVYDSSTGWLTQLITPFKDSAAPDDPTNLASPGSWNVVTYVYGGAPSSPAISGGGDAANLQAMVEQPRETITRSQGILVGLVFAQYVASTRTIITHQPNAASLNGNLTASWTTPGIQVTTVLSGSASVPANTTTPTSQTTYSFSNPDAAGFRTGTITMYGPSPIYIQLTKTVETIDPFGAVVNSTTTDLRSGIIIANSTSSYDGFGRVLVTHNYLTGSNATNSYFSASGVASWFGPAKVTAADGEVTTDTYDSLGRLKTQTTNQVSTAYTYDGDGNIVNTVETGTANGGSLTISASATYDAQGRITGSTDVDGIFTNYVYTVSGGVITTTATINASDTNSGNQSVQVTQTYYDGTTKSVSGTATDRVNYDYGVDPTLGYFQRTITNTNATDTTQTSNANVSTTYFNLLGDANRTDTTGPSGTVTETTLYDAFEQPYLEVNSANSQKVQDQYDPATGDVIGGQSTVNGLLNETRSLTEHTWVNVDSSGHVNFEGSMNPGDGETVYPVLLTATTQSGDTDITTISATSEDGLRSWSLDPNGVTSRVTVMGTDFVNNPGAWTMTTTNPDGTVVEDDYVNDVLTRERELSAQQSLTAETKYQYDGFWRNNEIDAGTGSVSNGDFSTFQKTASVLRNDGQVSQTNYPDGTSEQVLAWDPRTEQPLQVQQRDGTIVNETVNAQGQVTQVSGGGATPVKMGYNNTAGTYTLTTFKDGNTSNTAGTNAATTTWQYDPKTNLLQTKTYADGSQNKYIYNAAGQILTQDIATQSSGAAATVINYSYTSDGHLKSEMVMLGSSYNNAFAYTVQAYDRFGNPRIIEEQAGGEYQPVSNAVVGGQIITDTFDYDAQERLVRESMGHLSSGDTEIDSTFAYYGTDSAFSGYDQIHALVQKNNTSGTQTVLTQANYSYNASGYLNTITGLAGSLTTSSTSYTYYPGTDTVQTATMPATGGDVVTTYSYDASFTHLTTIATTINGITVYSASYLYYPANSSGGSVDQVQTMNVTQKLTSGVTDNYYVVYTYNQYRELASAITYNSNGTVRGTPESFSFDALGNNTAAGYSSNMLNQVTATPWTVGPLDYYSTGELASYDYYDNGGAGTIELGYDGLDRLGLVAGFVNGFNGYSVGYAYDSQNRLVSRSQSVYPSAVTTNYSYDGDNLTGVFDGNGHLQESFTWDPTSAGGVGGLLAITTYAADGAISGVYIPTFDAHGDVTGLIDPSSGAVVATYSYSAFGQITSRTWNGPAGTSDPNLFFWQTMYYDSTTGLYDDHERWYSPKLGRFLTRDPSGEGNGGVNLYEYGGNNPITHIDSDGKAWTDVEVAKLDALIARQSKAGPTPPALLGPGGMTLEEQRAMVTGTPQQRWAYAMWSYAGAAQRIHLNQSEIDAIDSKYSWFFWTRLFYTDEAKEKIATLQNINSKLLDITAQISQEFPGLAQNYAHPPGFYGKPAPDFDQALHEAAGMVLAAWAAARAGSPVIAGNLAAEKEFANGAPLVPGEIEFFGGRGTPPTGTYKTLAAALRGSGYQANHLNQDAAYKGSIPTSRGLSVAMKGDAFTDMGSPHYDFHESLEEFWKPYRKGSDSFGLRPSNADYVAALKQALMRSGYSALEASILSDRAASQQVNFGLIPFAPVPKIPNRLPQSNR